MLRLRWAMTGQGLINMDNDLKNILKLILEHGDIEYSAGINAGRGQRDEELVEKSVEAFKKIKGLLNENYRQVVGHATSLQDTES